MNVRIGLIVMFLIFGCKESADTSTAESPALPAAVTCATNEVVASVNAYGNDNREAYPISNTVDGNSNSFMTTNTLSLGDVRWVAYRFNTLFDLACLEFTNDYTNDYHLGDLTVLVSNNSTNGGDGSWSSVTDLFPDNHGFSNGDGFLEARADGITWVKLQSVYNGNGAFGISPAFYLSEIKFYAN